MEALKYPYPVGTKLHIISAGCGAYGCNDTDVVVIEPVSDNNGISEWDEGFYVKIIERKGSYEFPEYYNRRPVWKVRPEGDQYAEYKVIGGDYEVELV